MLFNCHRDAKKSRPARPDDYNPFADRGRGTITAEGIDILKTVFVDNRPQ